MTEHFSVYVAVCANANTSNFRDLLDSVGEAKLLGACWKLWSVGKVRKLTGLYLGGLLGV
jgi:hypothetical protein